MIPFLYRVYELNLLSRLQKSGNKKVEIFEFFRGEWTFHTKGLWIYENQDVPSMTAIGSSNYSQRSYKRDNEIQFYLLSFCPKFKDRMEGENRRQFEFAQRISREEIRADGEVRLKWRHRLIYWLLRSFL